MFEDFKKIVRNVKALSLTEKNSIFAKIIAEKEVKDLILELNRVEQLFKKGVDDTDTVIGFYSAFTQQINDGKTFSFQGQTKVKKADQPIILFDSGTFYNSFKVKVYKDGFTINANDDKGGGVLLTKKFGQDILGLTQKSKNVLTKTIKTKMVAQVRKQVFK